MELQLRSEVEDLRRELHELRDALLVFEGEHARWLLRYTWRLAYFSNLCFAGFMLLGSVAGRLRQHYRISGFLSDILVPGAFRIRAGLSNTVVQGILAGLKPAWPFALASLLLQRQRGPLRMLGVLVSCVYSAGLFLSGHYPWANICSIVFNLAYLSARGVYRTSLAESVGARIRHAVLRS